MVDFYKVLGVSRDASNEDIKAAFRRLAMKLHPDLHSNASQSQQNRASESFRQVREAYEVLGDEQRREKYNRSCFGSSAGTATAPPYSSAHAARAAYERSSSSYAQQQRRAQWNYKTTSSSVHGGSYRRDYERTVRWNWPPPSEGPNVVIRATLFGMAVVTLFLIDPLLERSWRNKNVGKSYEEMVDRVKQEKRRRAAAAAEAGKGVEE